jgi:carboxymethylenebutenolidase
MLFSRGSHCCGIFREDSNEPASVPSDVIGLSKVMPPLSRRGFMSSSAAVAAGYTLAAGPVRADAI